MKPPQFKHGISATRKIFALMFALSLIGCVPMANNSMEVEQQYTQDKAHGKKELSQRQQALGQSGQTQTVSQNQGTAPMQPKIDCAKLGEGARDIYFKNQNTEDKLATVKVGATGYGAPPKNYYPEGQRRLMTMRASKIDAYRALAEIVGGLHVWGGSAIGDMVVERDRYRTFVDSYVRGAHVVTVEPMEDGTYKTVVEMEVDQRFLFHVMTFINPATDKYCYEQQADGTLTHFGYSTAPNFYYSE
ncbi:LPP20 family lipoprotein [Kaarinaea lacus]